MKHVQRIMVIGALAASAAIATATTVRSYYIGNSVSDIIRYDQLRKMAETRGHGNPWGRQMVPGAPLEWLWTHPADGFTQDPYGVPTNALPYYTWDALSLQPFDRGFESDTNYSASFVDIALPRNTNMQVFIYSRWPRQSYFLPDYDTTWLTNGAMGAGGYQQESREYFENLMFSLRPRYATTMRNPIRIAPCGDVMYALNQKMKAGQIPGFSSIVQVYADGIHLNDTGAYIVACTYFTVQFRESPIGLPGSQYGLADAALIAAIQTTVWEVVSAHPYAGIRPEILPVAYMIGVTEQMARTFGVRLTDPPAGTLTVSVQRVSGDADITISNGATLVYTPADYATWQNITLHAAKDSDWTNGITWLAITAAGYVTARVAAVEIDNDPPGLVCYEGFDGTPRLVHYYVGGYGWSGAWQCENGANGTGNRVTDPPSLRYRNLLTSGGMLQYASGATAGRMLDRSFTFASWSTNLGGTLYIGRDNTELWMSCLVAVDKTSALAKVSFDDSGAVYHDNNGRIRVRTVYAPGTGAVWRLSLMNDSIAQTTTAAVTTNAMLVALRMRFSNDLDQVDLFINPPDLGGEPPAVPDAACTVSTDLFRFFEMNWIASGLTGWLDEVRFGLTFADVTPVMPAVAYINSDVVVPGMLTNYDAPAPTIIYAAGLSGTGTYVIANGLTNYFTGSITPGFSTGTLQIVERSGMAGLGMQGDQVRLLVESGDTLELSNWHRVLNLADIDAHFWDITGPDATNWFLSCDAGYSSVFNSITYGIANELRGAVIYDADNKRVGAVVVPEPACASCVLLLWVLGYCHRRRA